VHGAAAYRQYLEHTIGLARRLVSVLERDPCFELLHVPQLSTVCFRHVPAGLGPLDLDARNRELAHAIQEDGRVYLAPAAVDDHICLRVCFVNFRTRDDEVDRIADVVRELGDRLAAG
jgi:aromatic-L-amino-acid decarboxylase